MKDEKCTCQCQIISATRLSNMNIHIQRNNKMPQHHIPPQIWSQKAIRKQGRRLPQAQRKRKKVHPKGHWKIQFRCSRNRQHDATSPQRTSIRPSNANRKYNEKTQTTFGLRRVARRAGPHLFSQRHWY